MHEIGFKWIMGVVLVILQVITTTVEAIKANKKCLPGVLGLGSTWFDLRGHTA